MRDKKKEIFKINTLCLEINRVKNLKIIKYLITLKKL